MLKWFRERRARVEGLADALISGRGAEAYAEARWRAHVAGSGATARQWRAVAAIVARKLSETGGSLGLDDEVPPDAGGLTTRAV
ncbi:MAG TPA: hypothetical protein VMI72_10045 [Roseiarcus sp.]|nr:hypothetical protein [Roseiarcus sp.]